MRQDLSFEVLQQPLDISSNALITSEVTLLEFAFLNPLENKVLSTNLVSTIVLHDQVFLASFSVPIELDYQVSR